MKLKMYCKTTFEMVDEFEKGCGLTLPEEYKRFLLQYNGGSIVGDLVPVIDVPNTDDVFGMKSFFGITEKQEYDLRYYNSKYKNDLNGEAVIIGNDYFGNYIVLLYDGNDIYIGYWDEKLKFLCSSENANTYLISESFKEFIEAFGEIELSEEPEQIEYKIKKVDYYPLGSIVVLKGAIQKMMITSRGLVVNRNEKEVFYDYAGVPYPEGLVSDKIGYFNHEMIDKMVFEGFSDDEDKIIISNINKFLETNSKLYSEELM